MECWFKSQSGPSKGIGNVLINLKLSFFRLLVVVKAICVKNSDCLFVDFLIPECKFHAPFIFPPVTCLPLPYLSHYFKYGTFQKKIIHRIC